MKLNRVMSFFSRLKMSPLVRHFLQTPVRLWIGLATFSAIVGGAWLLRIGWVVTGSVDPQVDVVLDHPLRDLKPPYTMRADVVRFTGLVVLPLCGARPFSDAQGRALGHASCHVIDGGVEVVPHLGDGEEWAAAWNSSAVHHDVAVASADSETGALMLSPTPDHGSAWVLHVAATEPLWREGGPQGPYEVIDPNTEPLVLRPSALFLESYGESPEGRPDIHFHASDADTGLLRRAHLILRQSANYAKLESWNDGEDRRRIVPLAADSQLIGVVRPGLDEETLANLVGELHALAYNAAWLREGELSFNPQIFPPSHGIIAIQPRGGLAEGPQGVARVLVSTPLQAYGQRLKSSWLTRWGVYLDVRQGDDLVNGLNDETPTWDVAVVSIIDTNRSGPTRYMLDLPMSIPSLQSLWSGLNFQLLHECADVVDQQRSTQGCEPAEDLRNLALRRVGTHVVGLGAPKVWAMMDPDLLGFDEELGVLQGDRVRLVPRIPPEVRWQTPAAQGLLFFAALFLSVGAIRAQAARAELDRRRIVLDKVHHDLLGPAATIANLVSNLADGADRAVLQAEADHLVSLAHGLALAQGSNVSRSAPRPRWELRSGLLVPLLERYQVLAEVENVELSIELDAPEAVFVTMDPHALRRAVANLIENSIKFAVGVPTITLRCWQAEGCVFLAVEDQGRGVPEGVNAEELFTAGFRAPDSVRSGLAGRGLGLAIVSDLVTSHGGEALLAHRAHPTVFQIRLPEA